MTSSPATTGNRAFHALMERPYLILVLTTLFWGGNVVAGKLAVGHIDAHSLMILRWTGALLLVLPFAITPLKRDWPVIRAKWWLYLFYGAVGFATFNVLVYVAAYYTSGVNISLEQVAVNIFVIIFNFVLFRTRVRGLQLLGVLVTILGVAIIATHGDLTRILTLEVNLGDLLVILACLAYAIYSIALRWRPQTHWTSFLAATCTGAILASLVYQATLGNGTANLPSNLAAIDLQGWLIAAYTVIFPSVISQLLYVRGVELIGSNRASLFVNLIPLFGTVGSVIVLGEVLQLFHIVAAIMVAAGLVLAEWSARRAV
ncbi:MAG TPA: DMT family transporter [Devosia sp.]|jgi:drug/metabolite transporter (DMT)-like permease|uniref:DMT family transporter n=1 Tax=Devosia sp. TaxID=1871048 RepID=UPI002DDCBE1A|nr:DMT family transporter [Devosia sp.]HEV2518335.1 DMT family transporter [Devosia sp.]